MIQKLQAQPPRLALFLALLLLANAGCAWRQSEAVRANSLRSQAGRPIGQEEVGSFLTSRVALLVSTARFPTNTWLAGDRHIVEANGLGCAAAIDPRGYFLTAAHCLRHQPVYLILYDFGTNGPTLWALRTRVVWRGNVRTGQPDLALLHVQRKLSRTFDWAEDVHKNCPVMAVGLSWTNRPRRDLRGFELMGGTILDCTPRKGQEGDLLVASDLPLQPGDSGGPLVDSEAHLVGINVRATPPFIHWLLPRTVLPMVTERPSPQWLSHLIEQDVAARAAETGPVRSLVKEVTAPGCAAR